MEKLRVAWFSPVTLPGRVSTSVSAYVSGQLLPILQKDFEIVLFHASFNQYPGVESHHYVNAASIHREKPFDVFFYQLEDTPVSNFVRIHMGLYPGIVWFHDFLFTTDGPEPILNSPWEVTAKQFSGNETRWAGRKEEFYRKSPHGLREGGVSVRALFSNERDLDEFRNSRSSSLVPEERGAYLPLPVDCQGLHYIPGQHGGREHGGVVGYAGSPRIENRAHKLLEAINGLPVDEFHLKWLIDKSESDAAAALLEEFGVNNCELIEGRSPLVWQGMVEEIDIAVHTLFSVYGQPGPYLSMSLAAGVPSLVTNFASGAVYPDSLVCKIDPGEKEATMIRETLKTIRNTPIDREGLSANAAELFDRWSIARSLAELFHNNKESLAAFNTKWSILRGKAHEALLSEVRGLVSDNSVQNLYTPVFKELGWS